MAFNKAAGATKMAGKSKGSKKVISHVTVHKGASGGHSITHHHTDPMEHPDEMHVTPNDAAMMQHMQGAMGNDAAAPEGAPPAGGAPDPSAPPQGAPPPAAM